MMCGWERKLLRISMVDAVANLVLSLILVHKFGVFGVALGTMIPTVLIGWLWVLPVTANFAEAGLFHFIAEIVGPVFKPIAAGLAVLAGLVWLAPFPADGGFIDCVWRGALVVLPIGLLGLKQLKSLRPS